MDTVDAPVAGWRNGAPPPQAGPALEEELDSSAPLLLAEGARPPGSSIAGAIAVRAGPRQGLKYRSIIAIIDKFYRYR